MILRVLDLLTGVTKVTQDTHAVLHRLVVNVVLPYGRLHDVQDRLDESFTFSQFPPRILAVGTNVPAREDDSFQRCRDMILGVIVTETALEMV